LEWNRFLKFKKIFKSLNKIWFWFHLSFNDTRAINLASFISRCDFVFKQDFAPLLLNRKRMNSIYLCEYFYLGSNKEVEKCELTIFHSWTNNCHNCWDSMFWRNWRYFFYIFRLIHTLCKQQCVFFVSFYGFTLIVHLKTVHYISRIQYINA
jgi:hypothetical protein